MMNGKQIKSHTHTHTQVDKQQVQISTNQLTKQKLIPNLDRNCLMELVRISLVILVAVGHWGVIWQTININENTLWGINISFPFFFISGIYMSVNKQQSRFLKFLYIVIAYYLYYILICGIWEILSLCIPNLEIPGKFKVFENILNFTIVLSLHNGSWWFIIAMLFVYAIQPYMLKLIKYDKFLSLILIILIYEIRLTSMNWHSIFDLWPMICQGIVFCYFTVWIKTYIVVDGKLKKKSWIIFSTLFILSLIYILFSIVNYKYPINDFYKTFMNRTIYWYATFIFWFSLVFIIYNIKLPNNKITKYINIVINIIALGVFPCYLFAGIPYWFFEQYTSLHIVWRWLLSMIVIFSFGIPMQIFVLWFANKLTSKKNKL